MSHVSSLLRKKERMEITLPTLIDYYLTSRKLKGCSPKTIAIYRSNLGLFIRFLESRTHSLRLVDLTLQDARTYVAQQQGKITKFEGHTFTKPHPESSYSPVTIHSHVRTLRSFSAWLEREGYTKTHLFKLLELPKLPQVKIDVLSPEEIQQILAAINPGTFQGARLMAIVLVLLDTGIRAGELVGLKLSDVDWERGVFKVFGKGAKERFVPVGGTAKQAMLRYVQAFRPKPVRDDIDNVFLARDGFPLSVNAIVLMMRRLAQASGVTRLHAHLLRHTCGVQYLLVGGDTKSLQMFLGHTTAQMTHHYEQFKDEHVLAQHRKHSPVDSLGITYRRFGKRQIRLAAQPHNDQAGTPSSRSQPAQSAS